jgi:hypothetical protein
MGRRSSRTVSSDPGATQSGVEWVADEVSRVAGGTAAVYGKGAARIKELLVKRGIDATEVASPAGAARVSPQVTTTLDVCATVKNGTVRARVDVVPKRRSGDPPPAPETVTVYGRKWAKRNLDTYKYKPGSGLKPIVKATGPKHFGELTADGKAACIYAPPWDSTTTGLAAYGLPAEGSRDNGLMFNKYVEISALECPVGFEVAPGDDWTSLRAAIASTIGTTDVTAILTELDLQTFKRVGYVTSYPFMDTIYDGYASYTGDYRGVWWTATKHQVFFTGIVDADSVGGVLNTIGQPIVPSSANDSQWTLLTPVEGGADNPQSALGFPVRLIEKVAA